MVDTEDERKQSSVDREENRGSGRRRSRESAIPEEKSFQRRAEEPELEDEADADQNDNDRKEG